MKIRTDFVTNSSSSSFIIENFSDEDMSSRDVAEELKFLYETIKAEYSQYYKDGEFPTFEDYVQDASYCGAAVNAHSKSTMECSDHIDEGVFGAAVHITCGWRSSLKTEHLRLKLEESHH